MMVKGRSRQEKMDKDAFPYQARLKLERAPFINRTPGKSFFADPELLQRLDLLQHLVQFSDLLLIVNGPRGSGKTVLLHGLAGNAEENWRICKLNAEIILDQNALLTCIADSYKLDSAAVREDLPRRLASRWKALQLLGKYPVLLIDNAHCMDSSLLRTLLHLDGNPRATLHSVRIILFSEVDIGQRLAQEVFDEPEEAVLMHSMELPPFSEQQTTSYLACRLAAAGHSGESPFSAHEVHSIHKVSGGLPYRINELAHQILLKQETKSSLPGGANTVAPKKIAQWFHWRWAALLLAGILVAFGLNHRFGRLFEPDQARQEIVSLPLPVLLHDSGQLAESAHGGSDAPLDMQQETAAKNHVAVDGVVQHELAQPQVAIATEMEKVARPESEITVDRNNAGEIESPVAEQTNQVGSSAGEVVATAADVQRLPATRGETLSQNRPGREAWILAQDPDGFTLQLVSVRNEIAAISYIKDHRLVGKSAYFEKSLIGTTWFSLLYGTYLSKDEALAAVESLAESVRELPRIRRLASVQAEIRRYRRQESSGAK
ncbi:MAG: SPOR domain-containing protein [Gammaproteobacteria bacterium]